MLISASQPSLYAEKINEITPNLLFNEQDCLQPLHNTNNLFEACREIESNFQTPPSSMQAEDLVTNDISRAAG
jgi:hypothetical protein